MTWYDNIAYDAAGMFGLFSHDTIEFNRLCTVFDDHSYYISFIIYAIFYLNKYLFLFNAVSAHGLVQISFDNR